MDFIGYGWMGYDDDVDCVEDIVVVYVSWVVGWGEVDVVVEGGIYGFD